MLSLRSERYEAGESWGEAAALDTFQLTSGHHRAQHIHRESRTRSIETCEIQAPGDSMTNVWRLPLVRTVSKAVMVALATFASIRPLTFCPETWPPWRY